MSQHSVRHILVRPRKEHIGRLVGAGNCFALPPRAYQSGSGLWMAVIGLNPPPGCAEVLALLWEGSVCTEGMTRGASALAWRRGKVSQGADFVRSDNTGRGWYLLSDHRVAHVYAEDWGASPRGSAVPDLGCAAIPPEFPAAVISAWALGTVLQKEELGDLIVVRGRVESEPAENL